MPTTKSEQLLALYRQQLQLFERMLAFAGEQARCVEDNNLNVLLEILARRQDLFAEVGLLAAEVVKVKGALAAALGLEEVSLYSLEEALPAPQLQPLAQILDELGRVAGEILAIDDLSAQGLQELMQGLKGEMGSVRRGQAAMRAYKNAPQLNDARFIDEQK